MKTVTVAFDVDGTLLADDDRANEDIRALMRILHSFMNVRIVVWSGSSELYARQRAREMHLQHWVDHYCHKGAMPVDIAIDDIKTTNLGTINLIC